jgi:hypothetical protein
LATWIGAISLPMDPEAPMADEPSTNKTAMQQEEFCKIL